MGKKNRHHDSLVRAINRNTRVLNRLNRKLEKVEREIMAAGERIPEAYRDLISLEQYLNHQASRSTADFLRLAVENGVYDEYMKLLEAKVLLERQILWRALSSGTGGDAGSDVQDGSQVTIVHWGFSPSFFFLRVAWVRVGTGIPSPDPASRERRGGSRGRR
jgi:type II secretory pathway component PulJ